MKTAVATTTATRRTRPARSGSRGSPRVPARAALFAGAFDPPHAGHFGIAESVTRASGLPVIFCTTVDPPHKAALGTAEVLRRARLLERHDALFTEGDPLYLDKARRMPGRDMVTVCCGDAAAALPDKPPNWVTSLV